jgi:2-iminobutanoate/2-iminopropanoate deaminase
MAEFKQAIFPDAGLPPVGPYSPAILSGNILFLSGQIALDETTGNLMSGTIEEETHQVMRNLGKLLQTQGLGYEHLVKVSIFLTDLGQFGNVNKVYASYFKDGIYPARETVQVVRLPKDAHVEMSAIAIKP